MAYSSTDQSRLVRLFGLDREELRASSRLKGLMDEQEAFDAAEGLTTVAEVKAMLEEIYGTGGLLSQLEAAQSGDYSSLSVQGEYSVAYGTGTRSSGVASQITSRKARIIDLLEPAPDTISPYCTWQRSLLRQPPAQVFSS